MGEINSHIHFWRAANGITVFRGTVMAGFLISALLTALPSVTFAAGRDGDRRGDQGRHSLVQQPYNVRNPFVAQQAQIDALQAEIVSLKAQVNQLAVDNGKLKADVRASLNIATADVSALQLSVKALETKPAGIPDLDKYVKIETNPLNGVTGPHILITGANVHVRSGSGFTNDNGTLKGLGNLIIGYNESSAVLSRTGSHNLIGGSLNSFSSFGGMVFGLQNTISGQYASVLGGNGNTAVGSNSTVYGGLNLTAANQNSFMPLQGGRAPGN